MWIGFGFGSGYQCSHSKFVVKMKMYHRSSTSHFLGLKTTTTTTTDDDVTVRDLRNSFRRLKPPWLSINGTHYCCYLNRGLLPPSYILFSLSLFPYLNLIFSLSITLFLFIHFWLLRPTTYLRRHMRCLSLYKSFSTFS